MIFFLSVFRGFVQYTKNRPVCTEFWSLFSAQKELWVDIVYEGAKEKTAQALDKAYSAIGKGWEYWKSGMNYIMGKG